MIPIMASHMAECSMTFLVTPATDAFQLAELSMIKSTFGTPELAAREVKMSVSAASVGNATPDSKQTTMVKNRCTAVLMDHRELPTKNGRAPAI